MSIESGMKLKGRLSWEVINEDGSIDKSSGGLYDNLILNSGLDLIGPSGAVTGGGTHEGSGIMTANTFLYCAVGTSNAAPNVSQSGFMTTEVARTNAYNTGAGMCGTEVKRHFEGNYVKHYRTFDFPKGTFNNESLAEVGFSPYNTKADNLWSRALFKVGGNPTTVLVSSTQILRVRYELTIQFDTAWNTGKSVNIGGTSYGYKDAFMIKNVFFANPGNGQGIFSYLNSNGVTTNGSGYEPGNNNLVNMVTVLNDDLTAINNTVFIANVNIYPTNTNLVGVAPKVKKYSSGNYYKDIEYVFDTSNFNTEFVGIMLNRGVGNEYYFVIFDTPFTKDSLHEMTINLRMSWGRA